MSCGIMITCSRCGGETPAETAFVDQAGLIVKCQCCGYLYDRRRDRPLPAVVNPDFDAWFTDNRQEEAMK